MPITDKRLAEAEVVVAAGVKAAHYCREAGLDRKATVDLLCDFNYSDDPAVGADALAELLGVALILLDKQTGQVQEIEGSLRGLLAAARARGITVDE